MKAVKPVNDDAYFKGCTGCLLNMCVFFLESLQPVPREHWAAIGCTKNYQPIGVTVHSHVLRALKVSYSNEGEGGVAGNCEKTQFFLNTLYINLLIIL